MLKQFIKTEKHKLILCVHIKQPVVLFKLLFFCGEYYFERFIFNSLYFKDSNQKKLKERVTKNIKKKEFRFPYTYDFV